jgi:hypothetical protein
LDATYTTIFNARMIATALMTNRSFTILFYHTFQKSATKTPDVKNAKADADSSSDEEKQWFTIKEKLLKKMINKKDTTR